MIHDFEIKRREDVRQTQGAGGMPAPRLHQHFNNILADFVGLELELLVVHGDITITFFLSDGKMMKAGSVPLVQGYRAGLRRVTCYCSCAVRCACRLSSPATRTSRKLIVVGARSCTSKSPSFHETSVCCIRLPASVMSRLIGRLPGFCRVLSLPSITHPARMSLSTTPETVALDV